MPYMPYDNYMMSQDVNIQQFGFFPGYGFNPWFGFGNFFFPFLLGALLF